MSSRENAIAALVTTLETALTGVTVMRTNNVPETIPADGLIQLTEGDDQIEALLSPVAYLHDLTVHAVVFMTRATEADRDADADALIAAMGAAVVADRTLGGVVDDAEPGAIESVELDEIDGAAKIVSVPIMLSFRSAPTPLS